MNRHHVVWAALLVIIVLVIFGVIGGNNTETVNQKEVVGSEGIPLVLAFFAGLALFAFAMGIHVWPHAHGKKG